jgi:DNA-binding transcriptional ArsR family regulator
MEAVLKAIAEPRRREILQLVSGGGELTAGEIAARFDVTRPAISQHLTILRNAGLLEERREGTRRLYRVRPEAFGEVRAYLESFWDESLLALKNVVESDERRAIRGNPRN